MCFKGQENKDAILIVRIQIGRFMFHYTMNSRHKTKSRNIFIFLNDRETLNENLMVALPRELSSVSLFHAHWLNSEVE